jgi:hypothetical protein
MSFERLRRTTRTVGFRLTVWSSSFFVVGSLALFGLAYVVVWSPPVSEIDLAIRSSPASWRRSIGSAAPMVAPFEHQNDRVPTSRSSVDDRPDGAVIFLDPERWGEFEL